MTARSLRWRHNGHDGVSNHQPHHCEFLAQMASNAENVSTWWRHHVLRFLIPGWAGVQWGIGSSGHSRGSEMPGLLRWSWRSWWARPNEIRKFLLSVTGKQKKTGANGYWITRTDPRLAVRPAEGAPLPTAGSGVPGVSHWRQGANYWTGKDRLLFKYKDHISR